MTRRFSLFLMALVALATLRPARAQLLYAPGSLPGGTTTVLFSDAANRDDEEAERPLGFTFPFGSNSSTTVLVSVNGYLSHPLNYNLFEANHDDKFITAGSGQFVSEQSNGSVYVADWNVGNFRGPRTPAQTRFQAALFGADTAFSGPGGSFGFLAGDIAFSYQTALSFSSGDATVGIYFGGQIPLPGDDDGNIFDGSNGTPDQRGLLPTSGNRFLLFRRQADPGGAYTGYAASVQTLAPVPEPGSLPLFGSGLAGVGLLLRQRRARRVG